MWKTVIIGNLWKRISGMGVGAPAAAIAVALVPVGVASAADLTIPIDTLIDAGVAEGQEAPLETVATGALEGATCSVRSVRDDDRGETHPGNDLVVTSSGETLTLANVEGSAAVVEGSSTITLGPTISVTLMMGSDEVFAAGITIEFDCGVTAVTALPAQEEPPGTDTPIADATAAAATTDAAATATPPDLPGTGSATTTASLLLGVAFVSIGAALMLVARRPVAP
jgi:LPXTG-motif cell wall-anchored protein